MSLLNPVIVGYEHNGHSYCVHHFKELGSDEVENPIFDAHSWILMEYCQECWALCVDYAIKVKGCKPGDLVVVPSWVYLTRRSDGIAKIPEEPSNGP